MIYRIDRDWYSLYKTILEGNTKTIKTSRTELKDGLLSLSASIRRFPLFLERRIHFSGLLDCPFVMAITQPGH